MNFANKISWLIVQYALEISINIALVYPFLMKHKVPNRFCKINAITNQNRRYHDLTKFTLSTFLLISFPVLCWNSRKSTLLELMRIAAISCVSSFHVGSYFALVVLSVRRNINLFAFEFHLISWYKKSVEGHSFLLR